MTRRLFKLCLCLTVVGLAGCSTPMPNGVHDPYEEANRKWHDTNIALDRAVVDPVSTAYGTVVPDPLRKGVSNVSDTLSLPGIVVNDVLQLQFGDALHNTGRLLVNATLGLGGLFDPATEMGLGERDSDFGETLHRWGVGEGAYVVLPLYGPSTERDAVGIVVDMVLDPVGSLLDKPESTYPTALKVADLADTRYRYSDIYEAVLYDSADSYTQMQLSYLDNRRFELGTALGADAAAEEAASYDIYEDFYE